MSKFSDFLVNTLLPAFETLGESKLEQVLQADHDTDPTNYAADIVGLYATLSRLHPLVLKTATKVDDAIFDLLKTAVVNSAAANGIVLPPQVTPPVAETPAA